MKYIAYIDYDNHGEVVNRRNGGGAYAHDYNTDSFSEQELLEICQVWEAEDRAEGFNRKYYLDED